MLKGVLKGSGDFECHFASAGAERSSGGVEQRIPQQNRDYDREG